MSDALPPTVKDRPGRGRRWLLAALALLLVVGAVGAYVYLTQWHYEPTAHRHVPVGTNVALRADAAKILMYEPVRKHLWPVMDGQGHGGASAAPAPAQPSRVERLEAATGVRPKDLRELVVASVDGASWVALVGGKFPKGRFVAGLHQLIQEDGLGGWSLSGELLVHTLGPAIGQADDGTLVFGTSADIARAALPDSDGEAKVPLPVEGAVSFVVNRQAWSGAVSMLPLSLPGLDTLSKVEEARGHVTLDESPQLIARIDPAAGTKAETLAQDLGSTMLGLRAMLLLVPGDLHGAKQALASAKAEARGPQVHLTAQWPYEAIDQALAEFAETIRTGRRPEPAKKGPSWLPW